MNPRIHPALPIICLMAACASAPRPTPPPPPAPPLAEVMAQAQQQRKPIVLELFASWCGPCKYFARQTLPHKDVQKALADVIFVRYDAEQGLGEAVAKRFQITSYPSFLVLDPSGMLCQRVSGEGVGVKGFVALLRQAGEVTRSKEAVQEQLAAHRTDPELLLHAARWHLAHHYFQDAFALYDEAANLPENGAVAAAQARWEGRKVRRFLELRRQIIQDAREQLSLHPGTPSAGRALPIAVLSGELPKEEATKLLLGHLQALKDPPPQPLQQKEEDEASLTATLALEDAVEVALAAHLGDEAMAAAQRLVAARPKFLRGYLLLARAHSDLGDQRSAAAQLVRAETVCTNRKLCERIHALRARYEKAGKLRYGPVDGAQGRIMDYFVSLEGGSQPLDGIDAVSPLLFAGEQRSSSWQ